MKSNDFKNLYNTLVTARIYASEQHEKLYNANEYIDACIFQSIRDSIDQNIKLLKSYRTYTTELQYRYRKRG